MFTPEQRARVLSGPLEYKARDRRISGAAIVRGFPILACFLIALPAPSDQEVTVGNIPSSVLESRLREATVDNHSRQEAIRSLFAAAGCDPAKLEERKIKHSKWAN